MSLTVGSLFAGIGGFDRGFELAGYDIRWQVEIDPWARAVLAKHWPDVHRHDDIRTAGAHNLEAVDVLCGGFPCQDISLAGKGAGITEGTRSGLWSEYARLIGELRPRYVVVENVAALLVRGFDRVLGDLAACGYDAEWDCIPAAAVGAPHRRDRLWLVAYPLYDGREERPVPEGTGRPAVSDAARRGARSVPHPIFAGLEGHVGGQLALADYRRSHTDPTGSGWWALEPDMGRVAARVPARVDRLRGLGNAIVPQIAEWIAHRITAAEAARLTREVAS